MEMVTSQATAVAPRPTTLRYVRWFADIAKADVTTVGGKGTNLGEMTQAGLPVPSGFPPITVQDRIFATHRFRGYAFGTVAQVLAS